MSRMPPSLSGGLLCANAAVAATASTEAKTPERTRFIKTSQSLPRLLSQPRFRCLDHAATPAQRQGAARLGVMPDSLSAQPKVVDYVDRKSRSPEGLPSRARICYNIVMAKQKDPPAKGTKVSGFVL